MQNVLFSYGIFEITLSLLFSFIGGLISVWMLSRTVHEKKLSLQFLADHILLFSISALVMGRLGVFLFPLSFVVSEKVYGATLWYEKVWEYLSIFFSFWQGGINLIWSLAGFLLTFLILCLFKNQHPLSWMDAFSLPAVFFLIFYAIGTFFSGENYGKPVPEDFILSTHYNIQTVQYSGSIHPVQLYEAIGFLILFFIAWKMWEKYISQNWPSGIFGGIILSSMFFILFALEFLRWDTKSHQIISFIPDQGVVFLSVAMTILLFMFWKGHFWVFSRFKTKF